MNKAEKFLKKSLIAAFFLFLILLLIYSFSIISKVYFISLLIGGSLATFNFLLGIIAVKIGFNRSQDIFFKAVLGGMLLRLLLMLSLVFISLKFLNINKNSFIFSILFFYTLYLIIEVIYLYMKKT
jgi:hypothetical protein